MDILLLAHHSGIEEVDHSLRLALAPLLSLGVRLGFVRDGRLDADEVLPVQGRVLRVLPLMLTAGYITQNVIPRELSRILGDRKKGWELMSPLGIHAARLADLVGEQIQLITPVPQNIVVLTHGSKQPVSEPQVFYSRLQRRLPHVTKFFLVSLCDGGGGLEKIASELDEAHTYIQPYFLLKGHHLTKDLSKSLAGVGLSKVRVLPAIGEFPGTISLIASLLGV